MLGFGETLLAPVRANLVLPPHALGWVVLEVQELLLQHFRRVSAHHLGVMHKTANHVRECFFLKPDAASGMLMSPLRLPCHKSTQTHLGEAACA
jgi:hypothetical protein